MSARNYTTKDGSTTVIGGSMIIKGALIYEDGAQVPEGACGKAALQPDSTAKTVADLRSDFNDLLGRLKAAGLMETGND